MEIIEQGAFLEYIPDLAAQKIEAFGRTCYKSEDLITADSAAGFIDRIIKSGHESVIEHLSASVRFITDRGVTHELVRHRLAAYSQESTRYVNYAGKNMQFILPVWMEERWLGVWTPEQVLDLLKNYGEVAPPEVVFLASLSNAQAHYNQLIKLGWKAQQARNVLPNSLKTEIVATYNFRTWRHIIRQRTSKAAHPQIRKLMQQAARKLRDAAPEFFTDLEDICFYG